MQDVITAFHCHFHRVPRGPSGSRGQNAVATYSMRMLCFHSSTSFTSSWDPPSGKQEGKEGLGLSLVHNLHLQHGPLAQRSQAWFHRVQAQSLPTDTN